MQESVESSAADLTIDGEPEKADPRRGEPTSQAALNLEVDEVEARLGEMIEEQVRRRFQSAKDKRWAQLEKQYGDLSELREVADALLASDGQSPARGFQPEVDLEARLKSLAELPGLRQNEDARAIILRNMSVGDLAGYVRVVEQLLQLTQGAPEEVSKLTAASPATAVIPGGSDAAGDLAQAYAQRKQRLRPGDINALTALKREFRHKGLDIF